MRAVRFTEPGGPDVLRLDEAPDPAPGPEELLVRVESAGVNRADLLQRMGRYPAPAGIAPGIPGLEFAGCIEGVGALVHGAAPGDRVMGLVGGAAYAEYVVVRFDHVLPVPAHWSDDTAAGVPEAFLTAHDVLHQAGVERGERVLIHAVGSSVGLALLALARARGATVIGTSRSAWKLERAVALGLDVALNVEGTFRVGPDLADSVDVVCDLVGGDYLRGDVAAAAPRGRVIVIGLTGGRSSTLDLGAVLRKRVAIVGTALRSRSDEEKASLVESLREQVIPEFARNAIVPVIDRVFPMAAAADAHRYVEGNRNFGSVVLSWEG